MPAKASTGLPFSAASASASGSSRPWNTGMSRACARCDRLAGRARADHQQRVARGRAGPAAARAADRPETPCRCRCRGGHRPPGSNGPCAAPGSGSRRPSRSTPAPAARAASAPAARSRATMVGARRASSSGSSPTSAARWRAGSTRTGPCERAAIAAAEHERPPPGRIEQFAPPRSRSASCRRRRGSDCRRRAPGCRRDAPAAPSARPRPRHRSRPAATAGPSQGPAGRHQNDGSRMVGTAGWPVAPLEAELHEIRVERRHRPVERAGQRVHRLQARSARPSCAPRRR